MKQLTTAQMREADRRCIEDLGMPGVVLMNNAGTAVFNHITRGPVGVVCGKGNNGGDGFVVARLALLAGFETRVVLTAEPDAVRGDAAVFMRLYQNIGGSLISAATEEEATQAVTALSDCAVLVDALLGTGIKGSLHGPVRAAIAAWPSAYTIAVDLPSGMDSDTGQSCGRCIRANLTVTFAFAKQGFAAPEACANVGKLVVADIGIPDCCADDEAWARCKPAPSR
ncbi:MAG: NAD(P)H-hydrate epimerase [Candidatus Hydrogenedentales bacterium]|jgi:hydroxyethylthiazole kinase-like uncharacterized protein yjeF